MNIKKKILGITIAPVIILGLISMFLTTTMVRSAMLEEIEEALRGTAAATLAAYDQNTGDYLQTSNGDIWKGSYNISKSESLVDRIKGNTGMDVTFFYGDTRIMTSAVDAGGNRILNSKAGDRIVEKVLQGGESYFSHAVSIEGTLNYGYFIPVYQNGSTDEIIGMIFVGTDKQEKDAVINKILGTISMAVCAVMILCIAIGMKLATSMSRNIRSSIEVVGKVADGDLNVWVEDKLLGRHDEIGDLSRVTITLRDAMKATIQEISQNAKRLLDASELLGTAADQTNGTMDHVRMAVNQIVENSTEQAQNSQNTSEHMRIMGENITETSAEVELLDDNAASMQQSSEKAAETLKTTPGELIAKAQSSMAEIRELHQTIEKMKDKVFAGDVDNLMFAAKKVGDLKVVTAVRQGTDANDLRKLGDFLRDKDASIVAVLGTVNGEKVTLLAVCGKNAVASGIKAGDIIRNIAPIVGGKGGGKPDSAMGGGTNALKLDDALAAVDDFVAEHLK